MGGCLSPTLPLSHSLSLLECLSLSRTHALSALILSLAALSLTLVLSRSVGNNLEVEVAEADEARNVVGERRKGVAREVQRRQVRRTGNR